MKVELRIDPGCGGVSVVINAPALTDEVKALAARLEGYEAVGIEVTDAYYKLGGDRVRLALSAHEGKKEEN